MLASMRYAYAIGAIVLVCPALAAGGEPSEKRPPVKSAHAPPPAGKEIPSASADRGPSLMAHWTFDEPDAATVPEEASGKAQFRVSLDRPVNGTRGVHGRALALSGTHALAVRALGPTKLEAITFSAWVRPTELSAYREIFRQECDNRLLFSFQENGRVLSLGLNVGGYVECDAEIDPRRVLDGQWHHCAGTFDGRTMRVYLDGKPIGALERPGTIAVAPGVPAFIGSSQGHGEHFQGALDDLRIDARAESAEEIEALYRHGLESIRRTLAEQDQAARAVFADAGSFAAALAGTRANLQAQKVKLDGDLAAAIAARLRASFPTDYENFLLWTEAGLLDYLTAQDNEFHRNQAGRLVTLLMEYQPLTEHQRRAQTAEQTRAWQEARRSKSVLKGFSPRVRRANARPNGSKSSSKRAAGSRSGRASTRPWPPTFHQALPRRDASVRSRPA